MHTTQLQTYTELLALGLSPIPVLWNTETKLADKHPLHEIEIIDGKLTEDVLSRWLSDKFKDANAMALKMYPPFGSIDFDLKNTDNKAVFDDWLQSIRAQKEDVLKKVCIERTRNKGYHVYIKYPKLSHKIPIARNPEGGEIISVYTGGLLSYCTPTPGYEMIHGEFSDIEELTDDEFEMFVNTAAVFNEMQDWVSGEKTVALMEYPSEYENTCLQFDAKCTDDVFDLLLNSIDLYRLPELRIAQRYSRQKYIPYLRQGSMADYSAKAYFHSKRLLIFSASMVLFPTWHDSVHCGDESWSLSPSKIIYYKNKKNWPQTIEEIECICDSANIEISKPTPLDNQPLFNDRLKFPFDVFPDEIINYINYLSINEEYFAAYTVGVLSACIGKTAILTAKKGYQVKCNVYLAIVGSPGSDKSPAISKAFKPLKQYDHIHYVRFAKEREQYALNMAIWEKDKKNREKPSEPVLQQVQIEDSTIEMTIKIMSQNKQGNVLFSDELSGFLNRMNQYKSGDEIQKWLTLWSGGDVMVQRMSREENKVTEPFISIVGGIQAGVMEVLSSEDNEHNGFYHRFLFSYPEPRERNGFMHGSDCPDIVEQDFDYFYGQILEHRKNEHPINYRLSTDALHLYALWHDHKNTKYNKASADHIKGIIAKYQNYCLRFALLLQVAHDRGQRTGIVDVTNMERAIRLTEYFMGNMIKALRMLRPESPADKLPAPYDKIYAELSEAFTMKTATEIADKHGIKLSALKMFINRYIGKLFDKVKHGEYLKKY